MKKLILLIFSFIICISSAIAEPIIVRLEPQKKIVIEGRTYYIAKVVDNRETPDKEIGTFGSGKRQRSIELEDKLEPLFYNYLSEVFPMTRNTGTAVTMIVNSILCESTSELLTFKAQVTMNLEFVTSDGNTYKIDVINSINRPLPDSKTWSSLLEKDLIDAITNLQKYFK